MGFQFQSENVPKKDRCDKIINLFLNYDVIHFIIKLCITKSQKFFTLYRLCFIKSKKVLSKKSFKEVKYFI